MNEAGIITSFWCGSQHAVKVGAEPNCQPFAAALLLERCPVS